MNYDKQLEHLAIVQRNLSMTELVTRQALNHLVLNFLGAMKDRLDEIGLSLVWEEEFIASSPQRLTPELEMIVGMYDGSNELAQFTFSPRSATEVQDFVAQFDSTASYYISVKEMQTCLNHSLLEKPESKLAVVKI